MVFKCLSLFCLALISFCALVEATVGGSPVTEKSCRSHPKLVGSCFKVHGRLSVFNGAPALRIWKIGTSRMFGISDQRFVVEGYRNIPEDLRSQVDQDKDVFADFTVCPFTKQKEHEMQIVCVEKANNVVVKKR